MKPWSCAMHGRTNRTTVMPALKNLQRFLMRAALYPFFAPYISMPGKSHNGRLSDPGFTERRLATRLRWHVRSLADTIGVRHIDVPMSLERSVSYISGQFAESGYIEVVDPRARLLSSGENAVSCTLSRQVFDFKGHKLVNIIAEVVGTERPDEIVVYGAHYDTTRGTKGADDNASAVAALLELARMLRFSKPKRTIRFVAFPNEEDSGEAWENMGSYQYARLCHERGEKIVGMISLEMLGYYSDQPGSQHYPFPFNLFYPDTGNFIAFVGNVQSRAWVKKVVGAFREHVRFPSEGAAAPD